MKSEKTSRKRAPTKTSGQARQAAPALTLSALVDAICKTDRFIAARVGLAVNTGLTKFDTTYSQIRQTLIAKSEIEP